MPTPTESAGGMTLNLLDHAPFGVHLYELFPDGQLVFIGANATANELLGVNHRQYVSKTIEEAFPSLTATEIPKRYRAVVETQTTWQTDQIDYDERGIKGAFDVRAVPCGQRQVAVYFKDITARLRTEHALIAKQAELDAYFAHALDLLCIATVDGRFKRLNPEWEHALGYTVQELEGQNYLDFVHPEDVPATLEVMKDLASNGVVKNFVNRYRCKDDTYRWIEWRSFPVGDEIYAVARDVTERTELLARLRESETLFRNVINSMSEMVSLSEIIVDDTGQPIDYRTLDVNPAWEKAIGRSRDEAIGTTGSASYGDKPPYVEEFGSVALGGPPVILEIVDPHHSVTAQVSVTSPRRGLFVVVATDITERVHSAKKIEQTLQDLTAKTKEMEDLLYVTTHDLRSPLVNIQGFSSRIERALVDLDGLVRGQPTTPKLTLETISPILTRLHNALGYITGSAQKMDRLISGLLLLSRLGRRPLQRTEVDMAALWKKVGSLLQHQIYEAQLTVETGPLPPCSGDISQLDQVLSNLLDNAIKYRDPKRPCVVTFSGEVEPDGSVLYRFSDTGRGIEPRHVDRIWELFHRLSPQSDLPGEGIGLTAVRNIVNRHGGTVTVESTFGVGSTFLIRLPAPSPASQPTIMRRVHE